MVTKQEQKLKQAELEKTPTGIQGLDEITFGGLPKGRPTLICGGPGCGKTLFAMEFLYKGVTLFNEPGVFISFEEKEEDLIAYYRANKKEIKNELEKNKALFEIMNRAFSLEGCDFEIEYEKGVEADLPNLMNLRKTGQLLILKAIDNIEEGNYDNAVNNCAMCLLLGTDLSDTKVVICFMTGLSLIEKAEVPLKYMLKKGFKADYEPVKTGLNTIVSSFKDNMVKTLEVERLCGINLFRSIGRRDLPSSYKSGTFTGPMLIIAKPYILADELYYMRYMKKIIDDMKKNPPASFQQPPVSENYVLSNLLITNLNKAFEENEDIIKECEELLKSFE